MLRVGGVETYDAWTVGDVGFTSPAVMEAGRLADDLIFEPGFVRGGPELISNETWDDQLFHMLNRNSVDRRDRAGVLVVPPGQLRAQAGAPRVPGSARTSTSSCCLRSIRISRLRASAVACSRRHWSTGPRFGRSWSSWRVRSGARSGRPMRTAASSLRTGDSTSRRTVTRAEDPAAAVRIRRWRPRSGPRSTPVCGDTTHRI